MGCVAGCASPTDAPDTSSSEPELGGSATVHFSSSSWEPRWEGTPHAGRTLAIDYDFARLPQCRNTGRLVSWVVEVSYRFDGGPITTSALAGSPGTGTVLPETGIAIPESARAIELWFQNRAVGGYDTCASWDSRFGANYTHDIAPAD